MLGAHKSVCDRLDSIAKLQEETNSLLRALLYPITSIHGLIQGIHSQVTKSISALQQQQRQSAVTAYAEIMMRACMTAAAALNGRASLSRACAAREAPAWAGSTLGWIFGTAPEHGHMGKSFYSFCIPFWIKRNPYAAWRRAWCFLGGAGRLLLGLVLLCLWLALSVRTLLNSRARASTPAQGAPSAPWWPWLHLPARTNPPLVRQLPEWVAAHEGGAQGTAPGAGVVDSTAPTPVVLASTRAHTLAHAPGNRARSWCSMSSRGVPCAAALCIGDYSSEGADLAAARAVGVALLEGVLVPALVAVPLLLLTGGNVGVWLVLRMVWCGALHLSPGAEAACVDWGSWALQAFLQGGRHALKCWGPAGEHGPRTQAPRKVAGVQVPHAYESGGVHPGACCDLGLVPLHEGAVVDGSADSAAGKYLREHSNSAARVRHGQEQQCEGQVARRLSALAAKPFLSYQEWQEKLMLQQAQQSMTEAAPRELSLHPSIRASVSSSICSKVTNQAISVQGSVAHREHHGQQPKFAVFMSFALACSWPATVAFLLPAATGVMPYAHACLAICSYLLS